MTEKEVRFILYKASAAYPNQIELEDETIAVWIERLAPLPFEIGLENLNYHLDTSGFFPKIPDILRLGQGRVSDSEQQKLETTLLLEQKEDWWENATPPPENILKKWGAQR